MLIDPGSTLSYVTPYVVVNFAFSVKNISKPFSVSTFIGESIVAKRVYKNYVLSIFHRDIVVNLEEPIMVDFDVMLRMD